MKHYFLVICVLLSWSELVFGQEDIPKNYFTEPLDITTVLAGTFGELRSNHFHSGLDIKTERREGLPVYATASGTVTRIKIAHYGYGKALYITHPNGYTTVYAHLQKLCPEIEDYIKEAQYKKESFEIELFPKDGQLEVAQGELIAYSGNTGSSGGPHLHYEIRDKNSRPMNPFLFGMQAKDTREPLLEKLIAYPLDKESFINQRGEPQEIRVSRKTDGTFQAENIEAIGNIGFGIATVDQLDLANNKNGIYKINSSLNGEEYFNLTMDKFSFAETRYLNRMIDYEYYQEKRKKVQKLFIEKNNPLSIYGKVVNNGVIRIDEDLSYQYHVNVSDYAGNTIHLNIPIQGKKDSLTTPKKEKVTDHYVYSDQAYNYESGKFSIYIPKGALYEDSFLDIKVNGDKLTLHDDVLPVHKNILVSYDISEYKEEDRDKLYLGRINYRGDVYYSSSRIKDNKLTMGTRTLGEYTIATDVTPPIIKGKNVTDGKWMSKYRYLSVEIDDTESGISGYRATVNGNFILMEYDPKTKALVYDFNDKVVKDTENKLKLIVTDNVGNSTTFEATFFRKDIR